MKKEKRLNGAWGKRVERTPEQLKQTAIAIFEYHGLTNPILQVQECIDKLKK